MKIAKIVKSNSHIDYTGRVIDLLDAENPPKAEDYGFAHFVEMPIDSTTKMIGVIYNSLLINPDYANYGPRLSPKSDLSSFSPDYLNEQGQLIGILLLGWYENGIKKQGVPQRIVPAGQEVFTVSDEQVIEFHKDDDDSLQIHYYSQIVAHAGLFSVPLIEKIIEKLSNFAKENDKNRLNVLKNALAWQRTVGGMRL